MTKKEIIIKAWMDLNIETPFGICDKTGWFHGYFCNGINDISNMELVNFALNHFKVLKTIMVGLN